MAISNYTSHFSTWRTMQTEPIPGQDMIENNASGYAYEIDKWQMLRRFLILGSEGGTYYVSEKKLTKDNCTNVISCIKEDAHKTLQEILTVSIGGLAPKNDPAIFALALMCTFAEDKKDAYSSIIKVCRTGTHLFSFCEAIKALRGWSRGLRNGVGAYYKQDPDKLEYQVVKYRQRNGWTHRDVLRLTHPKFPTGFTKNHHVCKWAVGKLPEIGNVDGYPLLSAYLSLSNKKEVDNEAIELIKRLPWEAVPTEFLKDKRVWEALIPTMPLHALMRNLNKLSLYAGIDSNLSQNAQFVADRFNPEAIRKARLHPLKILEALKTYSNGQGFRGSLTWHAVPKIVEALDEAFYMAFENVEPTGKKFMIGLDVSGSMESKMQNGVLSCAEAAAALCMTIVRREKEYAFMAFSSVPKFLNLTPSMRLPDVLKQTTNQNFGQTDCSLPMMVASQQRWVVDSFQVITDNETYAGSMHPSQALGKYRRELNPEAKLVVWGMTATNVSIANPKDKGMMDVCGFDTSVPETIRSFLLS